MKKRKNCSTCGYFVRQYHRFICEACGTICCVTCLTKWIDIKTQSCKDQQILIRIPCISKNCKNEINLVETYTTLPEPYKTNIDSILQKNFKNSSNISCPCAEYNKIPFNNDPQDTSISLFRKLINYWKILRNGLSNKNRKLSTKPCPNCKTETEKDLDWDEITCINCQYEYCWVCDLKTPLHNEAKHRAYERKWLCIYVLTFLSIVFLLYQIPFLGPIIIGVPLHGLIWCYSMTWRYIVGFLFLQYFYSGFLEKRVSLLFIISSVVIIHFWGGYYTMLKIIIKGALIWKVISLIPFLKKAYQRKVLFSALKYHLIPRRALQPIFVPLVLLFVVFPIYDFVIKLLNK